MAAMQDALPVDAGAYSCALALDTACYSVWIALLLFAVKYSGKWNKACKADTSGLDAVAAAANEEIAKEANIKPTAADWIFLIGVSLMVSAVSQWAVSYTHLLSLSFCPSSPCTFLYRSAVLSSISISQPMQQLSVQSEAEHWNRSK